MRGWFRTLLIFAVIVAGSLGLKATVFRPRPIEVEAARVGTGVVEDAVTNSQAGTVRSRLKARVGPERAGRIVEIPHREGSAVARGDILLRLDPSTARTQLDLARRDLEAAAAAVDAARAQAALAGQDYERTERLSKGAVVSQEQMDQARARRDAAEAELEASAARVARARSAVRLAEDELNHLAAMAPFDGVVTQRFVEVGETVVPGQAALEVMSPDSLYISAPIDEIDIGRIHEGLPARVNLDPFPGLTWAGTVSRVSPYVNDLKEQNRTLEVEVNLIPDPGRPVPKPGTSADVEIILDKRENVLRVPTFSVIEGKRVLVVAGGKAAAREITIGLKNWEWTEIQKGLSPGELVITSLEKPGVKAGVRVKATEKEPASRTPRGTAAAQTASDVR